MLSMYIQSNCPKDLVDIDAFAQKIESDKIAVYEHWSVHVDIKQYYLGRVFVWAKRPEASNLFTITQEEHLEFYSILQDLKKMYDATFCPDELNVAFLGNEMPHCHGHIVPRYKTAREFMGVTFEDENWGQNYSRPNAKKFKIDQLVHENIREKLKFILNNVRNIDDKNNKQPSI